MADYLVTITLEPVDGAPFDGWQGTTLLDLVSDDDPLRVAFELGGLSADAIAAAADAGDARAGAALEARAVRHG